MATVIDNAVDWALSIANDPKYGYDQGSRWGPDYDCSSFVITAWKQAGVDTGATYTGDMYSRFTAKGFKDVTGSVDINSGSGMQKGDVLLNAAHHTAMYIGNGQMVQASINELNGVTGGQSGDQTGTEIYVCAYKNYRSSWDYVLRYPGGSTNSGGFTVAPGINLKTWEDTVTPEKLEAVFDGALKGLGRLFVKYSIAYQVNPALAAAIAMHETGNGSSKAANSQKNLFGYMTNGGSTLASFDSYEDSIKSGIRNLSLNYLYQGLNTVSKIQKKYAPTGAANDPNGLNNSWVSGVTYYYQRITGKNPSDLGTGVPSDTEAQSNMGLIQESGGASATGQSSMDITSSRVMAAFGQQAEARQNQFKGRTAVNADDVELYIIDWSGTIYKPVVLEGIEWETAYSGSPAQLTFTVIKDENISFLEGSQVVFKYRGAPVFYGFVFKKTRDKDQHIKCVCYDQTRYLQNKTTMVYSDKTAKEVIEMIAKDFSLVVGELVDTAVKIPLRVEDNASLFDIIQYALGYTTWKTGIWYTFYDDFGRLMLKKSTDVISNCVIDQTNAEDFDYESSINEETYTRIKRYYDNKDTGIREIYSYDESSKRPYYGVLELCEKIDDENIDAFRADAEAQMQRDLRQYAAPTRSLSINNVFGDVMVRGGSIVYVAMDLGDIVVNSQETGHYFVCDSVKHTFSHGKHTMDVNLTGGGYRFI